MVSRRTFLKTTAAVSAVGCLGCATKPAKSVPGETAFFSAGFEGFVEALAYARCRAGEGCRVALNVREDRLLGVWADDDRFRIVGTGHPVKGGWRLETRGICMEFMLRMEIMGPIASTPHPRPGQAWEPALRVGDARKLMLRMLKESGVEVAYGSVRAQDFTAERKVAGDVFVRGQRWGTAAALAHRQGVDLEVVLHGEALKRRLARDFSLPG